MLNAADGVAEARAPLPVGLSQSAVGQSCTSVLQACDLLLAGGDDLVDPGDAVVEEVRDPPLLRSCRPWDLDRGHVIGIDRGIAHSCAACNDLFDKGRRSASIIQEPRVTDSSLQRGEPRAED